MKFVLNILFTFFVVIGYSNISEKVDEVLAYQSEFQFEKAEAIISKMVTPDLQQELHTLNELLFFAGQKDSSYYRITVPEKIGKIGPLTIVQELNRGYFELHYRQIKGDAFRYFYKALQMAREIRSVALQKAALLGILEYYQFEIAQNSADQFEYLEEFKALTQTDTDRLWAALYGMVYNTKILQVNETVEALYSKLFAEIKLLEERLPADHRLLPRLYFEKALKLKLDGNLTQAEQFFKKALTTSLTFPFHRAVRFFSYLQLSSIAHERRQDRIGLEYIKRAREHFNFADSLRSSHFINKFAFFNYEGLGMYDSAYAAMKIAYSTEYYLDFRSNSREVNRLNVVLETQEKELENLQLSKRNTWMGIGLGVVLGLLVLSYLGYKNIQSKKRIVENEKEMQVQKVETLLKEQELVGIDAMIAGQEKERRQIANDLHDNLGSLLVAIKHNFQNLKQRALAPGSEGEPMLQTADELIEEAYQKVRGIAHARNAGVHAQKGLLPAIKNFAAKVSIPHKLEISVLDHGMDERLENSLEITLFRIIQELITNIVKHAGATEATVQLTQHDDQINVMVEDNGKGMAKVAMNPDKGMGLYSIQKRIENLGGSLTVDSSPGNGTTVIIDIPLS